MGHIFISKDANPVLKNYFKKAGRKLIEIKQTNAVHTAVRSHADIYVCKAGDLAVIEPKQYNLIKNTLSSFNISYKIGKSKLSPDYPENIRYNAFFSDKYFIHNLKYSDETLISIAMQKGLVPINVPQGYTKCNIVEINNNSLITSDPGVAKTLKNYNFDVLLIQKGHVFLKGFDYGFLGGASGKIGDKIIFNGDLTAHPDFEKILSFIQKKGLKAVYFKEYPLTDIGSIIEI